jgi:putative DNA primase/helicase
VRPKYKKLEIKIMEINIRTDILPKLRNVEKNRNGYQASCPAHTDEHPSLSIKDENEKLVLYCHRGCEFEDILRALDLYQPKQGIKGFNRDKTSQQRKIETIYDYTDENGKLLYQVVRFENKKFGVRRPNGFGGWVWNVEGVKKTLYRLPEIEKAKEDSRVVIFCEGEKDVHNVEAKLNLTATTSPLGANAWKDEYADSLAGIEVVILPDNDEVGRKYAETVANSIYNKARSVKVINLPISEKEDVSDWIEEGGSSEELLKMISEAEEWSLNNNALVKVQNELKDNVIEGTCSDYLMTAPLTDTGNAECFLMEYGNKFIFNKTNQEWYQWNGVIWSEDKINAVDDAILKVIRSRQNVTLEIPDYEDFNKKLKSISYMIRCEDIAKRKNIKEAVELLPQFITTIEQYDKDLFLAATQNGTLDLRNGSFRDSKQEDFLTLQFGTKYNADADCPRWKRFLREIFNDDEEMIDFIQRIAGYCLTGDISEQVMFILYGFGKNGKSVFLSVLGALLGDYAGTASFKTFDADKQSEQSNDLAMLKGKRFVSMCESAADRRLNEPLIKQVTGGDEITCRFLRKEFFSYTPQFKLFLATNHKPVITQSDFGIWRRIVLIPFEQNFDGREDTGLKQELLSELPGILNWAIEGLKKWHKEGLKNRPQAVIEATAKYKKDSDTIGQWLEANMIENPNSEIQSSEAYNNYKDWATENGHYPVGNRNFKSYLEERGFYLKKKNTGNYWQGFGFVFNLK